MFGMDLDIYDKNYSVLNPIDRLPLRVSKFILPLIIKDVLSGIEEIQCKIHNIILTGKYIYRDIENKFTSLKIDNSYRPYHENFYAKKAFGTFEDTKLNIYVNPKIGFFPNCLFSFVYNGPESLSKLAKELPQLNTSEIEYTIDFVCKGENKSKKVRNLFLLFRHYIYSPNKSITDFYHDRENFTYYIGKKKNFKIYERGPDKKKKYSTIDNLKLSIGWPFSDLDRVRLEITLDKQHIKKMGLQTIGNFNEDCKFSSVFNNAFSFRKFKKTSNKLPYDWENYRAGSDKTENGYSKSFQDEYIFRKKNKEISSLGRNTELATHFDQLMIDIKKSASIFSKRFIITNQFWRNKL